MASCAKVVVSLCSVAVFDPGCSLITCSIGTNREKVVVVKPIQWLQMLVAENVV